MNKISVCVFNLHYLFGAIWEMFLNLIVSKLKNL